MRLFLLSILLVMTFSSLSQKLETFDDSVSYYLGKELFNQLFDVNEAFSKLKESYSNDFGLDLTKEKYILGVCDFLKDKNLLDLIGDSLVDKRLEQLFFDKYPSAKIMEPLPWDSEVYQNEIDSLINNTEEIKDSEAFTVIEEMPKFPGGEENLYKFLGEKIKYPDSAKYNNIQGRVFVQFVVETDGNLSNFTIARGIGYGCDEEALRVIKMMPRWYPGLQRNKRARVKYTLPILYQLR